MGGRERRREVWFLLVESDGSLHVNNSSRLLFLLDVLAGEDPKDVVGLAFPISRLACHFGLEDIDSVIKNQGQLTVVGRNVILNHSAH